MLLLIASSAPGTALPATVEDPAAAAAARIREGLRLEDEGRQDEAVGMFGAAIDLHPGSAEGHFRLGELLGRMGYRGDSRLHLRDAVRLAPDRPEIRIALARIQEEFFDHQAALESFEAALSLQPDQRQRHIALIGIGQVRERLGRFAGARESYLLVLKENPRSPAALARIGILNRNEGDLAGAIRSWELYLELRPENSLVESWVREDRSLQAELNRFRTELEESAGPAPERWVTFGELLRDANRFEEALQAFQKGVDQVAEPRVHLLMAEILQERGDWEEADAELQQVLEGDPENKTVLYRTALGRKRSGDCRGEEEAWRRLARVERLNPYPFRMLVQAIECSGQEIDPDRHRLQGEVDALRGKFQENPEDPEAWLRLAVIREAQGRTGEMFEALRRAIRPDPNDPFLLRELRRMAEEHPVVSVDFTERFHAELREPPRHTSDLILFGYLARLNGSPEIGERLLQAVLREDPESAPVRVALGSALDLSGVPGNEPEEELRRAVAIDPGYAPAYLGLGMLALQRRRPEEAVEAARKLLHIRPGDYHGLGILGSALVMAGDLEGGCRAFREALEADPIDPEGAVRFQFAVCLAATDRRRQARRVILVGLPYTPEEVYRQAWQLVRDYYVDRGFNGIDWESWRHRFDGRMEDRQATYGAVAEMLASLGNRYTRLRSPEETVVSYLSERSGDLELDPQGRPMPTSKSVISEELAGGVQYLRLTNFSDPRLLAEVRKLLRDRRGQKGVILDLRGNPGGSPGESEMVGSLFLGEGVPMGQVVDRWGKRQVEAGGEEPIAADIPVVILVDENTGSAAENLAGALRGSGRAKVIGRSTRGKGSSQVTHLLPGGAMVLVTTARNLTPQGKEIEGRGILPDVELKDLGKKRRDKKDEWIEAAEKILAKDAAGTGEKE